jgi:S1-C subfamily serine protease
MKIKLVIRYNGLVLETMEVEEGSYEIGRGSDNEININHPSIHRRQGKLSFINNRWVYQDHESQRLQTLDNTEAISLSSDIDIATEAYTLSEQTGDFPRRGGAFRSRQKLIFGFISVFVIIAATALLYTYLKNRGRHANPNELLAEVRSKIVEFEKTKDPQAIEDYKKYGGFRDEDFRESMGYCTGFLVAPNVVLTASHCLWGSDFLDLQTHFELRMHDNKKFKPLRILGFDPLRDYLFLELEGAESYGHLEFADDFKIGQTVYTLGNAHGQGIAIREGIMANETQDLNDPTIKYIRYSAGASPGNSGGPLLDSYGKIVALVFAATGAENYNLGTSCHDLKVGFAKFVKDQTEKNVTVKVKRLFNFNLQNFLQKQVLPFLQDYSEYPDINQIINQVELTFSVPMEFDKIGEIILTEINSKSTAALAEVEKSMIENKQVVLDWSSYLSEKTPVILPSQFDSSQNSFFKHKDRFYMKVAGFLDSPNRKDFKSYVEQLEKEKKFDFQAYGMNFEYKMPQKEADFPQYLPQNPSKNKSSIDELAQGSLYGQLLFGKKTEDEDLIPLFLKNYFGEEGVLSGTYSAFIRPQSYKTFTIKNIDKKIEKDQALDGLSRQWSRWHFKVFDQIYFYIYCLQLPEGAACVSRVFPIENEDRLQIVEANFRQHILGHFLENPFFWQPSKLIYFFQTPLKNGLSTFMGTNFTDKGSYYALEIDTFKLEIQVPKSAQSVRIQTGLYQNKKKQNQWAGFGAEWIVADKKSPQMCGVLIEPLNTQSIYVLNFLRDTLKRLKLKEEDKKEEIPKYWTKKHVTPQGEAVQLVGYCAPIRENPIEIGAFFVDLKKAKPFTGNYKPLK